MYTYTHSDQLEELARNQKQIKALLIQHIGYLLITQKNGLHPTEAIIKMDAESFMNESGWKVEGLVDYLSNQIINQGQLLKFQEKGGIGI